MTNLKIYQICHNLITYFVTLTSPKKVNRDLYLGPEGVVVDGSVLEDGRSGFEGVITNKNGD